MARFTIDIPDWFLTDRFGDKILYPEDKVLHALTAGLAGEDTHQHCVLHRDGTVRHIRLDFTVGRLVET